MLFLTKGEDRKGVGGVITKGYGHGPVS